MKRILCLIFCVVLVIITTACGDKNEEIYSIVNADNYSVTATATKLYVDELFELLDDKVYDETNISEILNDEYCYNVTPKEISNKIDAQIFKFSDSFLSLIMIDGDIYPLCDYFGGYGFVNAVPWDYDEDGNYDLLVSSSSGSGMHRSNLSVFNTKTKTSIDIYSTMELENPCIDLIVQPVNTSLSSVKPKYDCEYFNVYSVNIEVQSNNSAMLKCSINDLFGEVVAENGVPVLNRANI